MIEADIEVQKSQPGYWFDWNQGVSNHPQWDKLRWRARAVDMSTGEEVYHVVFYHCRTHYLVRILRDEVEMDSHDLKRVVETREIEVLPL